ncbi:MAG: tetratricopeptide repeat protein [Bacteroidetes bacterium]|nr:tetratricopeptide repeat protein [Bacteroidota bacterium]
MITANLPKPKVVAKKSVSTAKDKLKPTKPHGFKPSVKPYNAKKANRYFVLFFFLLAFVLYANTTWNKFAVDDEFVTGPDNGLVNQGFKAIPKIFSTFYVSQTGNIGSQNADYRPIVKLTFAIEYQLWGEKPGVSHGINVLIYFLLSTLLFFILKRLLKNYNILFPFLITVLFMIHPIHSEVVASLKNRDEMLAFICGLGALYYMLKYVEEKKTKFVIYSVLIFCVGYLCKSSISPFLGLIPLVLYFFTDTPPKKLIPVFLFILAGVILAYFVPRLFLPHTQRVNYYIENPLYFEKGIWLKLGTGFVSLLFYLKMLVNPYPLIYYYGYNTIPITTLWNFRAALSFLIYAVLFIYATMNIRKKSLLSFSIFFYLVAIFMYSNILTPVVGIVAERFLFVGSIGFCIALVYLIFRIFRTEPKSLTIELTDRIKILSIIFLLVIPSAYYVIKRNRAWRNLYDLTASDLMHGKKSAKVNIQFAGQMMNRVYKAKPESQLEMIQRFTPVITYYFQKGLNIYPRNYQALNDLASVYVNFAEKPDSSAIYLRKAIAMEPTLQPAWVNLGLVYRKLHKYDSATYCYQRILKENPKELKALIALANINNDLGNFAEALKYLQQAIQNDPSSDLPYRALGNYYITKGDTLSAIQYWIKASEKNPAYDVFMQLNSMYRGIRNMEKANYYYEKAMELTRKNKKR